ncbi:MAG: ABC transporter ATP-binding protein [Desulfamplus sp.]|nr:ABC transporter ATP-binding protein [Desulfamplus sp.]
MLRVNVQNLNKNYYIYQKPHHRLLQAILRRPMHTLFEVLKDISFEVGFGQSLGIIGDNGAGKSTLLKLLAGTVQPTSGTIEVNGRVAALLELGAGFHPEFTGRQNIYLNASLLGISDKEIREKEKEIIEFAEIEDFIDRPVKTYSSGMYVRLAFSIATMVDPDILIVDEALSVGDISFQLKCTDRMNLFREQGKTMIFCSHSMYHVQELCEKAIWIDHGRIRYMGSCAEAVSCYEDYSKSKKVAISENIDNLKNKNDKNIKEPLRSKECHIGMLQIEDRVGNRLDTLNPYQDAILRMDVEILKDGLVPRFGFGFLMPDETPLYVSMTHHDDVLCGPYLAGEVITVRLFIKNFPVRTGSYRVVGGIAEKSGLLWYEYKVIGPIKIETNIGLGLLSCEHNWQIASNMAQDDFKKI